jgi:hypothetical protein
VLGDLGQLPGDGIDEAVVLACTDAASGWSQTECSIVLAHGQDAFGVADMRLAA